MGATNREKAIKHLGRQTGDPDLFASHDVGQLKTAQIDPAIVDAQPEVIQTRAVPESLHHSRSARDPDLRLPPLSER